MKILKNNFIIFNSFKEREGYDIEYYLSLTSEQRIDIVIQLRARYLRLMGHKNNPKFEKVLEVYRNRKLVKRITG